MVTCLRCLASGVPSPIMFIANVPSSHHDVNGILVYIFHEGFNAGFWDFTSTYPYILCFTKFVSYRSLEEVFLLGDFNAQPSSLQGQDFHLDVSGS